MILSLVATAYTIFVWFIIVTLMMPEIHAGTSLGKSVVDNWVFLGIITLGACVMLWAVWR